MSFVADEAFLPSGKNLMRPFPGRTFPERDGSSIIVSPEPGWCGECLWDPVLTVEDVSPPHRGSA